LHMDRPLQFSEGTGRMILCQHLAWLAQSALHRSLARLHEKLLSASAAAPHLSIRIHYPRSIPFSSLPLAWAQAWPLFKIYNWQVPPPAPVLSEASYSAPERLSYDTGIIMATRRIAAVFRPESPSKRSNGHNAPREPRKSIPGWTDGSNAWRAEVYSFVPPTKGNPVYRAETTAKAYSSFVASPHRSCGIYSTLGKLTSRSLASTSAASSPLAKTPDMVSTKELCSKFSESDQNIVQISIPRHTRARVWPLHQVASARLFILMHKASFSYPT
jgi:hypothetical protein